MSIRRAPVRRSWKRRSDLLVLEKMTVNGLLAASRIVLLASLVASPLMAQSTLTPNTIRLDSGTVSQRASITDFSFLTGRWTGPGLGGETDELWSAPAAGTMTGTFRLIQGGKVVFYEFFALEEHEGTVALRLKHFDPGPGLRGWEQQSQETLFRLVRVADRTAWFHGLTYRLEGPDTLVIYLALRGADQVLREETFRMRRVGS
jgi:hypothetical protein